MFLTLFKRFKKNKVIPQVEDRFFVAEVRDDDYTFFIRFKEHQEKFAESGKYPYQIKITTLLLHSNHTGFPSKEENEQLLNMETILIKDLSKEDVAIFVGAITGGGMKEFVFYTGKPKEAMAIIERLRNEIKHHTLQYVIEEDPLWKVYKAYVKH